MDEFDAVLDLEEKHFASGFERGVAHAEAEGHADAEALGMQKGRELGTELGGYFGRVSFLLDVFSALPDLCNDRCVKHCARTRGRACKRTSGHPPRRLSTPSCVRETSRTHARLHARLHACTRARTHEQTHASKHARTRACTRSSATQHAHSHATMHRYWTRSQPRLLVHQHARSNAQRHVCSCILVHAYSHTNNRTQTRCSSKPTPACLEQAQETHWYACTHGHKAHTRMYACTYVH
eukprot:6194636-Pleurochrysis_carterae.AAC.3